MNLKRDSTFFRVDLQHARRLVDEGRRMGYTGQRLIFQLSVLICHLSLREEVAAFPMKTDQSQMTNGQ
jgi:hypothetical protein